MADSDDQLQWIFDIIDSLSTPTQRMSKTLEAMAASLNSVDAMLKKMDGRLGETAAKTNETSTKIKELTEHTKEASESMEGLFTLEQMEVGYHIFEELVDKVKELVGEIIHASSAAEKLDLAISSSVGDEGKNQIDEYIEKIEKHTAFDDDELKKALLPLLNQGIKPGAELEKMMATALSYATRTNSGIGGVEGMLGQFARIKSRGEVNPRMLPQLGIDKDDFNTVLAKTMGMSVKEAEKRMTEGKIKGETLMSVIYNLLGKHEKSGAVGGAGVDASKTLDAQIHRLRNMPEDLFKTFRNSDGYAQLKDFMAHAIEGLMSPAVWGRAEAAITALGNKLFKSLNGAEGRAIFEKVISVVIGALEALPGIIDKVATGFKILWPVVRIAGEFFLAYKAISAAYAVYAGVMFVATGGLTTAMAQLTLAILANPIGFLIGLIALLVVAGYELITHWTEVKDFFVGMWQEMVDVAEGYIAWFADIGGRIIDGLIGGIKEAWQSGKETVVGVWDDLKSSVTDFFEIKSPSKVFARIGGNVAAGFIDGIASGQDAIGAAMEDTFGAQPDTSLNLAGAAGGRGPVTFSVQLGGVHVHMSGEGSQGSADDLGDQLMRRIRPELESAMLAAIDALNAEAGTDE